MAAKFAKTRFQNKYDLEVNWLQAENFIPLAGELIVYGKEVDPATGDVLQNAEGTPLLPSNRSEPYTYDRFKLGDGKTTINNLSFIDKSIKDTLQANLISCGTTDPDTATAGKFYFKYSE